MPDRIIRERVTTSPELDAISAEAERLFFRLMVKCDDYGRFEATPSVVLAQCFPRRAGYWQPDGVAAWLHELAAAGLIDVYVVERREYGALRTWSRHQRQRGSRPKFPLPPRLTTENDSSDTATPQAAASGGDSPRVAARARDVRRRAFESRESRDERVAAIRGELPRPDHFLSENGDSETASDGVDVKALLRGVTEKLGRVPTDRAPRRMAREPVEGREA